MGRQPRILRLVEADAPILLRSGKMLAFTLLALLPTLIVLYVAGLFWIPQSWQAVRLVEILGRVSDPYSKLHGEFIDAVKSMSGMITGFWAGFPMLIVASLVAAGFVSSERASGTFDLLATKPVHRYELVASKILVFLAYSLLILLIVQALNVLVVASSFFSGLGFQAVLRALWDARSLVAYYALASWLYVFAVTGLTLLFSVKTTREFVAVMGVVGYYIALVFSAGMVQTLMPGRTGRMISEILGYADFSQHARIVLTQWVYGSLQPLGSRVIPVSYTSSLLVLVAAPLLLVALSLYVVEKMDLA